MCACLDSKTVKIVPAAKQRELNVLSACDRGVNEGSQAAHTATVASGRSGHVIGFLLGKSALSFPPVCLMTLIYLNLIVSSLYICECI